MWRTSRSSPRRPRPANHSSDALLARGQKSRRTSLPVHARDEESKIGFAPLKLHGDAISVTRKLFFANAHMRPERTFQRLSDQSISTGRLPESPSSVLAISASLPKRRVYTDGNPWTTTTQTMPKNASVTSAKLAHHLVRDTGTLRSLPALNATTAHRRAIAVNEPAMREPERNQRGDGTKEESTVVSTTRRAPTIKVAVTQACARVVLGPCQRWPSARPLMPSAPLHA